MAGKVVVSTLNDDTGVLATQNGMTGIAKAWVNFDGTTGTIRSSFNVSSITVNGTGDYTANFTTAMPNTNYAATGSVGGTASSAVTFFPYDHVTARTTTTIRFLTITTGGSVSNSAQVAFSTFSS